jgi:thiol:disulfide interchange protein DsbA
MRNFFRGALAALALSAFACSAQEAPQPQFESPKNYNKVREVAQPDDPKRIAVQEFFWYGCPHCYAFDPIITEWTKTKPADVDFVRVPNSLGRPNGLVHSKIFYTEEQLGLLDKMHSVVFDAIHKDHVPMDTPQEAQEFFTGKIGLLPDVFNSAFNGFTVDSRVRRAEELAQKYAVASVPTIVVGGEYYTNAQMAGDFTKLTQLINFLVDKVRKERVGK